ncbi:hypothetical protein HY480_04780, partial [Candidatus Uhrbacteria bacterium]|nr:hypothetical protein [Candidatus Uhrbacteria bacterium]
MEDRFHIHANSKVIEERHRTLYERLYRTCPTVVSAPGLIRWSPTYAVGPGGIGLDSKLPLRAHFGIEPRPSGGLDWGELQYYLPERDAFVLLEQSRATSFILPILEFAAKEHGKSANARIWGLSEIPLYRGLNADTICAVPISVAWLLHLGVITPEHIAEFVSAPTAALPTLDAFQVVWKLALQLESAIGVQWLADGDLTMASLIDGRYPIAFFREKDPVLFDHYRDLGLDNPGSYYNIPGNLFYRALRMEEVFALDQYPSWPIDIAILNVGEEGSSSTVYKRRNAVKSRLDEVAGFIRGNLTKAVPETFREQPPFIERAQDASHQT